MCSLKIKKIKRKDVREMEMISKDLLGLEELASKAIELNAVQRKEDYNCDDDCGCHDCSTQGCANND